MHTCGYQHVNSYELTYIIYVVSYYYYIDVNTILLSVVDDGN